MKRGRVGSLERHAGDSGVQAANFAGNLFRGARALVLLLQIDDQMGSARLADAVERARADSGEHLVDLWYRQQPRLHLAGGLTRDCQRRAGRHLDNDIDLADVVLGKSLCREQAHRWQGEPAGEGRDRQSHHDPPEMERAGEDPLIGDLEHRVAGVPHPSEQRQWVA